MSYHLKKVNLIFLKIHDIIYTESEKEITNKIMGGDRRQKGKML